MNGSLRKPFFDTNVLLYTLKQNDIKSNVAYELLSTGGVVSVQVLNEFVAVARRKLRMSWSEIDEVLVAIRHLCQPVVSVTLQTHEAGMRIAARYGFQISDSLLIAAAIAERCDVFYSEDMQHNQRIEGVVIVNPFAK